MEMAADEGGDGADGDPNNRQRDFARRDWSTTGALRSA